VIPVSLEVLKTDVLILGGGGAGLFAALHAYDAGKNVDITLATKGLLGKSGCTRMVQGGYNAVLRPPDSLEAHFLDTIRGGGFLNDQELAWSLVKFAPQRILELESKYGCFFDRNPNGTIHQKPFAGQSYDRTVHKGDLTGIEIINRLTEQIYKRDIRVLEEHRAVELLTGLYGDRVVGALLLDIRKGRFLVVNTKALLLATGGGPTMYKIAAPSGDKSTDGLALAFRAGAELCDMEMVQFHPTGLLAPGSLMTGSVLEEGLRGVGGRLYNGRGERFMGRYDPERMERSTRDIVARAGYLEIMEGRGTPNGGIFLDMSHLGAEFVEKAFPGMVERCRDFGFDLAREPVEVSPTAHFIMGGVKIDLRCHSSLEGLFVAGEDSGGVHGANRLGGNGVADSTVFGGLAGEAMADYVGGRDLIPYEEGQVQEFLARALIPFTGAGRERVYPLRDALKELMWEKVGVVRHGRELKEAISQLEELTGRAERISVRGGGEYNLEWNHALDLKNQLQVSLLIATSALSREESRGSHYRSDYPETNDEAYLKNIYIKKIGEELKLFARPVRLSRLRPEEPFFTVESANSKEVEK